MVMIMIIMIKVSAHQYGFFLAILVMMVAPTNTNLHLWRSDAFSDYDNGRLQFCISKENKDYTKANYYDCRGVILKMMKN